MTFRWSFTSWATYNQCPAKYKFKYVQKCPTLPAGPAAARGTEIHENIADFITCKFDDPEKLHPAINKEQMLPTLNAFRHHPNGQRHVELPIYVNEKWEDVLRGSADRWATMIFDAVRAGGDWRCDPGEDPHEEVVSVAEWKSGKPKDEHKDQRSVYAVAALARFHYQHEVRVTTYYVEGTAPPARLVVKRSAEEKLQALWKGRIDTMRADTIRAPRPGYYCNWCDFSKAKGGPCQF